MASAHTLQPDLPESEMMYVTHALGKGLLFMTAGILIVNVGSRSLSKLGGLAGKNADNCRMRCFRRHDDNGRAPQPADLWVNGLYFTEH